MSRVRYLASYLWCLVFHWLNHHIEVSVLNERIVWEMLPGVKYDMWIWCAKCGRRVG